MQLCRGNFVGQALMFTGLVTFAACAHTPVQKAAPTQQTAPGSEAPAGDIPAAVSPKVTVQASILGDRLVPREMPAGEVDLDELDRNLAAIEGDPDFIQDLDALVEDTPDSEAIPVPRGATVQVKGVPLVYNTRVQKLVNYFQGRGRERFEIWLNRSGAYVPMMQEILLAEGLPGDLVYLALIESGFSPYAYSSASAVGFWQFINATGRRYGLRIDGWVDERRDPVKATRAAARYLKDLYNLFGDWHLAAAGYNAGEGKISRAMRMYDTESYWELVEHRYLKPETKDYVPKLIAAITIAKNPQAFAMRPAYTSPSRYESVLVPGGTDLFRAAYAAGVSFSALKRMNPELRRWLTPPDVSAYPLQVSAESAPGFAERLAQAPEDIHMPYSVVTLGKNETLTSIAQRFRVSLDDLRCLNPNLRERTGESVRVPVGDDGTRYSEFPPKQRYRTKQVVKAKPGETVKSLAKRFRISPTLLAEYNSLTNNQLKAGQKIKIPAKLSMKSTKIAKKSAKKRGKTAKRAVAKR